MAATEQPVTRRRLLRVGLGGVTLLGLGGAAAAMWRPVSRRAPPPSLRALDASSWQVLAAVAARICRPGAGMPDADTVDVASRVDALLGRMHPANAAEVRQLLGLLDHPAGGLLLDGRWGSFTGADPATQDAILAGWRDSRLATKRGGFKALAGLCASAYYADPRTWAGIGYPGPPDFGQRRAAPGGAG